MVVAPGNRPIVPKNLNMLSMAEDSLKAFIRVHQVLHNTTVNMADEEADEDREVDVAEVITHSSQMAYSTPRGWSNLGSLRKTRQRIQNLLPTHRQQALHHLLHPHPRPNLRHLQNRLQHQSHRNRKQPYHLRCR